MEITFQTELINNSYKLPQAKEVITNHGHTLVEKIMRVWGISLATFTCCFELKLSQGVGGNTAVYLFTLSS